MPDFNIRLPNASEDFTTEPEWPVTPELLAARHSARAPALYHCKWVAEMGGRVVGHLGWATTISPSKLTAAEAGRTYSPQRPAARRWLGAARPNAGHAAGEVRTILAESAHSGAALLERHGYQPT